MKKILLMILMTGSLISHSENSDVIKNNLESDQEELALIQKIVDVNFEFPHYEVGAAFLSGKILNKDPEKALFWLARSSDIEENDKADYLLAEIYMKGFLGEGYKDIQKAMFFYERSANRGNQEAKLKAAIHYLYNDELLDQEKGLFWLNKAMIDSNLTAHQLYSTLVMRAEDAPTILKQLDLVSIRSDKGDHLSSFYLGLIYLKNSIVKRDLNKSKDYFQRASIQGNLVSEDLIIQINKIQNSLN